MKITTSDRRAANLGREILPPSPQHASKLQAEQLIDDYILARIDYRVRRLADKFHLDENRQDDFRQDMIVELLKAADRFDPAGAASWHTYACRTLDLAVKKLTQQECRMRQREAGRPLALPGSHESNQHSANDPIDEGHDDLAGLELKLDIEVILARMPHRLQQACRLLMRLSPTEAATELGVHRNSIYRMIAQVREYFKKPDFGFCDFSAAVSASMRM